MPESCKQAQLLNSLVFDPPITMASQGWDDAITKALISDKKSSQIFVIY